VQCICIGSGINSDCLGYLVTVLLSSKTSKYSLLPERDSSTTARQVRGSVLGRCTTYADAKEDSAKQSMPLIFLATPSPLLLLSPQTTYIDS
jgi:hypothetical protein